MAVAAALVALALATLAPRPADAALLSVCKNPVCKLACRQACNALTTAKVAQAVTQYPAGYTDAQLAAELFTPDATLAVTPIGAFGSALTALEYITTFSRSSVRKHA
jgi:hypothetical protein